MEIPELANLLLFAVLASNSSPEPQDQHSDTHLGEAVQDSHRLVCTEVIARHTYPSQKVPF
jgi:hypothetical protein